jgi:Bacterial regulatory helix-turn-helix protein, lysR family
VTASAATAITTPAGTYYAIRPASVTSIACIAFTTLTCSPSAWRAATSSPVNAIKRFCSSSVTEAAEVLHYSQPSINRHLAQLEGATGTRLVQRVGRGIRLTFEGELLAATRKSRSAQR